MTTGTKRILGADGKAVTNFDYLNHGVFEFDGVKYPYRTINEKVAQEGMNPVLLGHAVAIQSSDFNNLQMLSLKLLAEDTYLGTRKFLEFTHKLGLCVITMDSEIQIAKSIQEKLVIAQKT